MEEHETLIEALYLSISNKIQLVSDVRHKDKGMSHLNAENNSDKNPIRNNKKLPFLTNHFC
jgi:hypothetical protein